MKKRLIAALLAMALTAAAFVGCAPKSSDIDTNSDKPTSQDDTSKEPEPAKEVTLKVHAIVGPQADEKAVFEALNKVTKEKLNTNVNYLFHGGAFADKIQVIIASGEEYDICFTSSWLNNYNTNVTKGAFVDITDMLEATPKLKAELPEYLWNAAKVKGKIYAVPNQQIVARAIPIMGPKEYIEGTGVDLASIKDLKSSEEYFQKAKDQYGARFAGMVGADIADLNGYEMIVDGLTGGAIKKDDATAKVVNFYETPEYKESLDIIADFAKKGLVDSEAVTNPEYSEGQRKAKKISAFYTGTYKPGGDTEESIRAGYDCVLEPLGQKPYVSTANVIATMQAVSKSSKNPERALQYLELINTDKEAMNILSYGIEGKHYTKVSDNVIKINADAGYAPGSSWAVGNVFNTYVVEGQPEDVWEKTKEMNDSAIASPILGFAFDTEPVKLQLTSVTKIAKEYEALGGGALEVEKGLKEMNAKMKTAGIDEVIAEMQRQIDEFMKTK